ncbi:hypothetical protein [Christiangramia sp.]|uniref:hypothetical protein n=1 Tax=Christiangramia sp. TaxID=1931228 RepID=UPI0026194C9C|nr:hypothetical protein [Christiangramia sp.]
MIFLKSVFQKYTSAPIHFNGFISNQKLKLFSLAILFLGFASCNPIALVNPETYGEKWDNTYLWFKPRDMTTIYISDSGDPETAEPIPNDSEFLIEWDKKGEVYTLKITSYYQDIDFAWFTGYDADNASEEIPWIHNGNTFELQSAKLLPMENEAYQISISDDLEN